MNFMRKTENVRQLYAYSAQHEKPSVLREISFISIDASSAAAENDIKPVQTTAKRTTSIRRSIAVTVSNEIEVSTVLEDEDEAKQRCEPKTAVKRHEMVRTSTTASGGDIGSVKKRSIQLRRKTTCGSQIGRSIIVLKKNKRSVDAVANIDDDDDDYDDDYDDDEVEKEAAVNKSGGNRVAQVKNSTNIKTISFNVPKLTVNSKEISKKKRVPIDWF